MGVDSSRREPHQRPAVDLGSITTIASRRHGGGKLASTMWICALYESALGRLPEARGLKGWVTAVEEGMPITAVAEDILASEECKARTGGSSEGAGPDLAAQLYAEASHRQAASLDAIARLVDPDWYRTRYKQVGAPGHDPIQHFMSEGLFDNLRPNSFLDPDWYLTTYPDVATAEVDPIIHYATLGWKEGRNPGPAFNTQAYLASRPNLRNDAIEPLGHYIKYDRDDPELHMRLGYNLKQQGLPDAALVAFRRSFELRPLRGALQGMRSLNAAVDLPGDDGRPIKASATWLEIGDLLSVMGDQAVVSGIQRVQFGILAYVLSRDGEDPPHASRFVCWFEDELWELSSQSLANLVEHYKTTGGSAFEAQKKLIALALDNAALVRPAAGDTFVSTGVVYFQDDLVSARETLRKAGVRVGMAIYDFIPLTNPEFCHPILIDDFSPSMSEALLQADFAITISQHVADETMRLMRESTYPAIPTRAVPLARTLEETSLDVDDEWTPTIAALRESEYVLCVSTLNAHKNHMFLLNLWRLLVQEGVRVPKLVLAGRRSYGVDDLFHQLASSRNLDGNVILIDGPTDREVATLYRRCLFTMFASYVEGWGLPVGESLARGKLCVASKTTSIPEVGGDLALYFDPYNIRDAATIVRRLLEDRPSLRALEAKVQREFRARSWDEYAREFIGMVADLSTGLDSVDARRNPGPRLTLGRMLALRKPPERWQFGTRLPMRQQIEDILLPRAVLSKGWATLEASGVVMAGTSAKLTLPVDLPAEAIVTIVLRFRAVQSLNGAVITIASGSARTTSAPPFDGRSDFIMRIDAVASSTSRVDLDVTSSHASTFKLLAVSCKPYDSADDILPQARLVRPTALIAPSGRAVPAVSQAAIDLTLRRRTMLRDGWAEPEAWGSWMLGDAARVAFHVGRKDMKSCRVLMRFRIAPRAGETIVSVASSKAATSVRAGHRDARSLFLALDCKPDENGRVELRIGISGQSGRSDTTPCLGLEGLVFGAAETDAQRLNIAEAILFEQPDDRGEDDALIRSGIHFNIIGHVNGTYSLANVNRKLAIALEEASPGSVRLSQVEVQPTRDLSVVPSHQLAKVAELAARPAQADGLEISISQHWPVWEPPEPGLLSLALVFWEEGAIPRETVAALNRSFAAVLAPSKFVAKALRDSGVRVPIRTVGFAPDLAQFAEVGAARAVRARPRVSASAPFTFLHISSCFPRKGVDVLLKAYADAFTSRDPVRLMIKTFPNPHNDVEAQIDRLSRDYPQLPEITVVKHDLSEGSLRRLYEQADAMVLPTRGEGFNIPAAEALASGLMLITTAFGAHLDFVDPSFARLVDYQFAPSGSHLKSAGSTWVDPDWTDVKVALREALDLVRSQDGKEVKRRLSLGRAAAAKLADASDWARRIESAAFDMLTMPDRQHHPHVAWVSSWDLRCGIAEYSRMLLEAYPGATRDVTVLCDDRTEIPLHIVGNLPSARTAWRVADPSSVDRLADQIELADASVVVIQHHKALIVWSDLARLLGHPSVSRRSTIVVLHNVQEILPIDHPDHGTLIAALSSVCRVLVHTVKDLNILKRRGLVANVALFPHGAPQPSLPPRPPRPLPPSSTPLIGAYGYLLPHKGFASLISALKIIRMEWPNARLRMVTAEYPVGFSATAHQECRNLAQSLGLEHAIEWHTDYLPSQSSLALLNECDVVVLPYQETPESSSAAVRTALAAAAPVAVTPLDIFQDVENAVLRLHGTDVESIAGGVSWLMRNMAVRAEMQGRAADWQEENSWPVVAKRLHDMIVGLTLDVIARSDASTTREAAPFGEASVVPGRSAMRVARAT